jgi:hypothetical protein
MIVLQHVLHMMRRGTEEGERGTHRKCDDITILSGNIT